MKSNEPELLDAACLEASSALFEALAHPVRLRIVCGLLSGECCVAPMTECLGLPQAFVSRHLAILRHAGVVGSEVVGRNRVYRVVHPLVPSLVALLQAATPHWSPRAVESSFAAGASR